MPVATNPARAECVLIGVTHAGWDFVWSAERELRAAQRAPDNAPESAPESAPDQTPGAAAETFPPPLGLPVRPEAPAAGLTDARSLIRAIETANARSVAALVDDAIRSLEGENFVPGRRGLLDALDHLDLAELLGERMALTALGVPGVWPDWAPAITIPGTLFSRSAQAARDIPASCPAAADDLDGFR